MCAQCAQCLQKAGGEEQKKQKLNQRKSKSKSKSKSKRKSNLKARMHGSEEKVLSWSFCLPSPWIQWGVFVYKQRTKDTDVCLLACFLALVVSALYIAASLLYLPDWFLHYCFSQIVCSRESGQAQWETRTTQGKERRTKKGDCKHACKLCMVCFDLLACMHSLGWWKGANAVHQGNTTSLVITWVAAIFGCSKPIQCAEWSCCGKHQKNNHTATQHLPQQSITWVHKYTNRKAIKHANASTHAQLARKQPTKHASKQPANQTGNWSSKQATNQTRKQATKHAHNQPTKQPTNLPSKSKSKQKAKASKQASES